MPITPSRRQLLQGAAAGAAVLGAPWIARAQAKELKMSVVGNRPLGTSEAAFRWADLVRERTQGRIDIKVYPASQLVGGEPTRELVAMRQGIIDFIVSSTINISPQVREMNLFSLPFLMPDHAAFDALTSGDVRARLDAVLAARDTIALAWSENGFRQVSNSKRDVRKPDDLKGLKIRFAAGQIYSEIFTALGANPLQMSWGDLQPALASGAVDGQETPINVFLQTKLDAVQQKHLTVWNYTADANIFHVATPIWNGFSAGDKDIVRASAEQAAKEHTTATRTGITKANRASYEELERRKVSVSELTEAELEPFRKATRPMFEKWAGQIGADLAKAAETAIAKRQV